MSGDFAKAVRSAEEEQLLEACRSLYIGHDERCYILARHRRSPYLLDLVLSLGGGLGDYIRMRLEVYEASMCRR